MTNKTLAISRKLPHTSIRLLPLLLSWLLLVKSSLDLTCNILSAINLYESITTLDKKFAPGQTIQPTPSTLHEDLSSESSFSFLLSSSFFWLATADSWFCFWSFRWHSELKVLPPIDGPVPLTQSSSLFGVSLLFFWLLLQAGFFGPSEELQSIGLLFFLLLFLSVDLLFVFCWILSQLGSFGPAPLQLA